jgi:hypothetical protein
MGFSPPIVILDACVLYPFQLRNLLIQFAVDRLVGIRWTAQIHDEWIRNLATNSDSLSHDRLVRTRDLMNTVLPDALVLGHEPLIESVNLPDPDDRHVVAAGIISGASAVITWNLRDFPSEELSRHGLRVQNPDSLLTDLYVAAPELVIYSTRNARANLRRSTPSAIDFITALERQNLKTFSRSMIDHIARI